MRIVPLQFVRVAVGLLGMFFAFELGRMCVRLRGTGRPFTKAISWILRTVVAVFAVLYGRGFDPLGIALVALIVLALAAGVRLEMHPRKIEQTHLFREP